MVAERHFLNIERVMKFHTTLQMLALLSATTFAVPSVAQQNDDAELAKQTLNPVAALISVPLKFDYNSNLGPTESGNQTVLTVQPVIPISISADWNMISRSIIPLISQHDIVPGTGTQQGFGDSTLQFYFSPKKPTDA